ncbi:MAG: AAA family ATPase, partial [Thaumarchaeota archaeon]|nr:AAA family ATPase [Nitrososphaerota archaeon]
SKFPGQSTLILDEPDIYMHPDLQRKMCKFLFSDKRRYPQVIITTHSVEIMSEVDAGQILILDRKRERSIYADSLPTPQVVLDDIGSVHNVHLARLNWSRRFLVVEGDDLKILAVLHRTLFRESDMSLDALPQTKTNGWGGWGIAIGAHQSISNNSGNTVKVYVIFDSDYHTEQEIKERYEQAQKFNMNLHVWEQKEIENYLLEPKTVFRLIRKRTAEQHRDNVTEKQVRVQLDKVIQGMKNDVLDQIASENYKKFKSDVSAANKYAREKIEMANKSKYGLGSLVSGKKVVAAMSGWANQNFNVSFSAIAIAREMYIDEVPDEMKSVLTAIERGDNI